MYKIKMLCYDADPTVKPYWAEPEGYLPHREWDVDPDDEDQSKCDWCEESGFCTLNEIL